MSSCCDQTDTPSKNATLTVALGGKSQQRQNHCLQRNHRPSSEGHNYPGVTVEKKTGRCKLDDGSWIDLIDLPGTYSLISRSPDETVAMEVLRGLRPDVKKPDAVIVVVDASNLQRNLYLVSQLIELGKPLVVARTCGCCPAAGGEGVSERWRKSSACRSCRSSATNGGVWRNSNARLKRQPSRALPRFGHCRPK